MSEMAILQIRKCLDTQSDYLDLGMCGLDDSIVAKGTKFDRLLRQCKQIKTLILSNYWEEVGIGSFLRHTSQNNSFHNQFHLLPPSIEELSGLEVFICSGLKSSFGIKSIEPLKNLSNLKLLNLSFNKLSEINELTNLLNLKYLDIGANQIEKINGLSQSNLLEMLVLSRNKIKRIEQVSHLLNLKKISLHHNRINRIEGFDTLVNLQELYLPHNYISEIKGLDKLAHLTHLNIAYNKITKIPDLKYLTSLIHLNLCNNKIKDISGLKDLTNLQTLDIYDNQITTINELKDLLYLRKIDFANNKIKSLLPLFPFLIRKEMPLKVVSKNRASFGDINIERNPVTFPPMEVVRLGPETVLRYILISQIDSLTEVREAKLVLTGSGESGKTSLSLRLNNKECQLPDKDDRTKDVEVSDYHFNTEKGDNFTAHIWDFGGQQILHNFHRLFMNDSALYVLLTETSRENDDFDYWLQTIRLFGGDSPILFVQNKRNGVPRRLSIAHYKETFNIKDDLYEVNLYDNEGLSDLEQAIQRHIQQLPIVKRTIPKSWFKLRKELEAIKEPFINYSKFVIACKECNIIETIDIEDAGNFLHQLGIILWYKDNPALRDKIILERHWATKALFQLVFDEKINGQQKGKFTKADAQAIWDRDTGTDYKYYTAQLIALMQEFKLAYRQRNKKEAYIIPALLPAVIPEKQFTGGSRITVIYEYLHLPRGLVNQLTAEMYEKIESDEHTWSEGVWLKEGSTEARIMENRNERTIKVEVSGTQHRELFGAIKLTLDNIHSEYKGIKYEMKIPCICASCKTNDKKHYFHYKSIIKRIEDGKKDTIECVISGDDVSLHALLDNILPAKAINEMHLYMEKEFTRLHRANQKTHADLSILKEEISQQNEWILNIYSLTQENKQDLTQLLQKVDDRYSETESASILQQIETTISENLNIIPKELAAELKRLSEKAPDDVDVKGKLKYKIPIIPLFMEYEGEFSMDLKRLAHKLRGFLF